MMKIGCYVYFALAITVFSRLNSEEAVMFVAAPSGIHVRNDSCVVSKSLGILHFGEKVTVLSYGPEEVIDNKKSKWTKIRSIKGEGWVFGGFLRSYDVNTLKTFSASFFRKKFSETYKSEIEMRNNFLKGDRFISLKEFEERYAPHISLTKIEEKDVKIVFSYDNLFVIDSPSFMVYMPGIVRRKSLWIHSNDKWTLIDEFVSAINIMYDGTDYPGIVIKSSETTYSTVLVLLYNGLVYNKVQEFNTAGKSECFFSDIDGKYHINFTPYYEKDISGDYYFNGKKYVKTNEGKNINR
ncbi:MAG: SH3 domain-containing protein [Spirochaetes bacterium]|nr:SH3 domain-containing protein [Spirochaetota bacterium]